MEIPKRTINLDIKKQTHSTVIDTVTKIYKIYFAGNKKIFI